MSTKKKLILDYDTFVNEGIAAGPTSTIAGPTKELDRFRPTSNYSNRQWLVKNYEMYTNVSQSNTRFSIGETVRCIDPMKDSHGMIGKIVAFEDNTIRWEVANSATGVGQTAKQFRCHAAQLEAVAITPEGIC